MFIITDITSHITIRFIKCNSTHLSHTWHNFKTCTSKIDNLVRNLYAILSNNSSALQKYILYYYTCDNLATIIIIYGTFLISQLIIRKIKKKNI